MPTFSSGQWAGTVPATIAAVPSGDLLTRQPAAASPPHPRRAARQASACARDLGRDARAGIRAGYDAFAAQAPELRRLAFRREALTEDRAVRCAFYGFDGNFTGATDTTRHHRRDRPGDAPSFLGVADARHFGGRRRWLECSASPARYCRPRAAAGHGRQSWRRWPLSSARSTCRCCTTEVLFRPSIARRHRHPRGGDGCLRPRPVSALAILGGVSPAGRYCWLASCSRARAPMAPCTASTGIRPPSRHPVTPCRADLRRHLGSQGLAPHRTGRLARARRQAPGRCWTRPPQTRRRALRRSAQAPLATGAPAHNSAPPYCRRCWRWAQAAIAQALAHWRAGSQLAAGRRPPASRDRRGPVFAIAGSRSPVTAPVRACRGRRGRGVSVQRLLGARKDHRRGQRPKGWRRGARCWSRSVDPADVGRLG